MAELLVALALIAILVAVALPVYGKQVKAAQESAAEQRLHLALRIARHVATLNGGAFPAPAELAQRMQESEPSLDTEVLPSLLAPAKPGFTYVVKSGTSENSILLAAESELGTLHSLFWEDGKSTYSRTRQPTYEELVLSLGPSAYWTLGAGPDGLVDKSGNGYTLNPLNGITNGGGPAFLAQDETASTAFNGLGQAYHSNYETRRNLEDNPSLEGGVDSWSAIGAATRQRVSDEHYTGSWSLRVDIEDADIWRGVNTGARPFDGRVSNLPDFQELIENPGFESGTSDWAVNEDVVYTRDDSKSYEGRWSLRITNNSAAYRGAWVKTRPQIQNNATVRTGAWVWIPRGAKARVVIGYYDQNGEVLGYDNGPTYDGEDKWQWVEHQRAMGTSQLARLHIAVSPGATVWIDGARMTDRPAPTLISSAYVKGPSNEKIHMRLQYRDIAGVNIPGPADATHDFTGSWQRISTPSLTAPLQAVNYIVYFRKPASQPNVSGQTFTFHIDSLLVEESTDVRYYFDGSTHGERSGWVGSPHLSPSDLGLFANGTRRTFVGWSFADADDQNRTMIGSGPTPLLKNGLLHFRRSLPTSGQRVQALLAGNSAQFNWPKNSWPGSGQWVMWALVLDQEAGSAEAFINGHSLGKQINPWTWEHLGRDRLRIGYANGSNYWSGYQGQIAVFEKALTPEQICALWQVGSGKDC